MPAKHPFNHYRRQRSSDGAGGWTETLSGATTMYGIFRAQGAEVTMLVDIYDDILPDDVLGITVEESGTEAKYSVVIIDRLMGTPQRKLTLQRIDRPITP